MNEAETRAEYIDPKLKESGWGMVEDSKVLREYQITDGRIQKGGIRGKKEIADYILVYKNVKLAVIEAKQEKKDLTEGLAQAKNYSIRLQTGFAFSTNGHEIYQVNMSTGKEKQIDTFPTPEELWSSIYSDDNDWKETFLQIPFVDIFGTKSMRYYQENAIQNVMNAIAEEKNRILLTMATGTGKTFVAFQIAWKLYESKWNLLRDRKRRPRILFLADRNILADQAFNAFSHFTEDALVRISPQDIRKKGKVPMNGSVFFTIFQTFMTGKDNTPYYGEYPSDFFDFIIIDECHRGGANDESNWRGIMEYFSPAVQLGLTATPKRSDNIDTYDYFGEPVYIYSLKEGINDGFLTPFRVKRIKTTLDEYVYTADDEVIEGEVEEGRVYVEQDFNKIIEIEERERKRVKLMLDEIDQTEKTIVFCATQDHALAVRNLVNQLKTSHDPLYCARVTANDGALGEQYLRDFQDNEKTIPTILTTSQKLSTGVDARNVRNIVLMRPINSLVEFKQIVGRGTRLFDGKHFFTIIDFVDAYKHFSDPEWDGEPLEHPIKKTSHLTMISPSEDNGDLVDFVDKPSKLKIRLADGKETEIQHMMQESLYSPSGKPISLQELLDGFSQVFDKYYSSQAILQSDWKSPQKRSRFLQSLEENGYGLQEMDLLSKLLKAKECDLLDVISNIRFGTAFIKRSERVARAQKNIMAGKNDNMKSFIQFTLQKYIDDGVYELDNNNLANLLKLKYGSITDAEEELGSIGEIRGNYLQMQNILFSD